MCLESARIFARERNAAKCHKETIEIRKQGRKEKKKKNSVVSGTEVVVQDENVTNDP